jgi:hypothetical protein
MNPEKIDIGSEIGNTVEKITLNSLNDMVNLFFPELETMNNEELKADLKQKATKVKNVMGALAEDPEVEEIIKDAGDVFGELTKQIIDAVEEPAKEIIDTSLNLASDAAITTGKTIAKTGVDIGMSALAEIPGVGGLIDLIVTLLVAFNGVSSNLRIAIANISKLITIGNSLVGDVITPVNTGLTQLNELRDRANEIKKRIQDKVAAIPTQAPQAPVVAQEPVVAQPAPAPAPVAPAPPAPAPPAPAPPASVAQTPVVAPAPVAPVAPVAEPVPVATTPKPIPKLRPVAPTPKPTPKLRPVAKAAPVKPAPVKPVTAVKKQVTTAPRLKPIARAPTTRAPPKPLPRPRTKSSTSLSRKS